MTTYPRVYDSAFVYTCPNSAKFIVYTEDQDKALDSFSAELGGQPKATIQQWVGRVVVKYDKVFEVMSVEHTLLAEYKEIELNTCPMCGSLLKAA